MSNKKITELTEITTPSTDDLMLVVDAPGGTPVTKKITWANVLATIASAVMTLTNKTLTSPVLNTGVSGTAVLDEDNMASDSATQLATQQSIKAYVDANAATTPSRARVYKDAAQSINTATPTILTFNQETFDNDTMHDNSTNNSRITITTAGLYSLKAQVAFAANATGNRKIFFVKNGSTSLASVYCAPSPTDRTVLQAMTLVQASASDYFEVQAEQGSGGALNIEGSAGDLYYQTHFEAVRLGA